MSTKVLAFQIWITVMNQYPYKLFAAAIANISRKSEVTSKTDSKSSKPRALNHITTGRTADYNEILDSKQKIANFSTLMRKLTLMYNSH